MSIEAELITVNTSLRDAVIAWDIINDQFRNEVHHQFSTSEEIKFFCECEADEFIQVMNANGLEAWCEELENN